MAVDNRAQCTKPFILDLLLAITPFSAGFHHPQVMSWRLPTPGAFVKQSGAVEACWAHNPEVRGSKPRSAKTNFSSPQTICNHNVTMQQGLNRWQISPQKPNILLVKTFAAVMHKYPVMNWCDYSDFSITVMQNPLYLDPYCLCH